MLGNNNKKIFPERIDGQTGGQAIIRPKSKWKREASEVREALPVLSLESICPRELPWASSLSRAPTWKPRVHPRWKTGAPKGCTCEVKVSQKSKTGQKNPPALRTQLRQGKMFWCQVSKRKKSKTILEKTCKPNWHNLGGPRKPQVMNLL